MWEPTPLRRLLLGAAAAMGLALAGSNGPATASAAEVSDAPDEKQALRREFDERVAAIFRRHCTDCHSGSLAEQRLRLNEFDAVLKGSASGPVLTPGDAEQSLLVDLLHPEGEPHMPPDGQLEESEIAAIRKWIDSLPAKLAATAGMRVTEEDRRHWAFQQPARPAVPEVADDDWPRTDVDAFVLKRLESEELRPSPPASRLQLIRRATYDLWGLPPSQRQVQRFLADESPDAYAKLIDRLLASPRYGERWGRHWLDLARYADSGGFEFDVDRPHAFRYRDYVIRSFNADKPYDRFIVEQLAGDEIAPDSYETLAATGFCRNGPTIANQENEKNRLDELDDIISTTGSVFLGLTIGCARCHDHKYDPIPQRDYYRLLAVFNNRVKRDVPIASPEQRARQKRVQARLDSLKEQLEALKQGKPHRFAGRWHKDDGELVQESTASNVRLFFGKRDWTDYTIELEAKKTGGAEGFLVAFRAADLQNFYWVNFGGWGNQQHGVEVEVDGRRELAIPRASGSVETGRWHAIRIEVRGDRFRCYLDDELVFDFEDETHTAGGIGFGSWRTTNRWRNLVVRAPDGRILLEGLPDLAETRPPARLAGETRSDRKAELEDQIERLQKKIPEFPKVMAIRDSGPEPRETHLLFRGDHRTPGPEVRPGAPAVLVDEPLSFNGPPAEIPSTGRRSTLARWIADEDNPLTARVMVNRIWQYHFGRGIVETSSNFGLNGARPTHPELLDWLAVEFMRRGWSIKAMHRLIMTSAVYRQSSDRDASKAAGDVENRLLWRFPPRRLQAEEIRDGILAASGNLNLTMYGPGVKPRIHPSVIATGSTSKWPVVEEEGPRHWRRSVYIFIKRSVLMPMMEAFDAPTATQSCERRMTTTVPTQALQLMNDRFTNAQARDMAQDILERVGNDPQRQVEAAYWRALSRPPNANQLQTGVDFLKQQQEYHDGESRESDEGASADVAALTDLCHVLFNLNEFIYVE